MRQGKAEELEYTTRHGQFAAQHSIQDFYDLVVELLTNSDDSYHGQFARREIPQDGGEILLELEPRRKGTSVLTIRDRAGGFRDLAAKLKKVGDRTSQAGDRGFMARGLKDCAALGHVTVETIVDGLISKAEITPQFKLIPWVPSRSGDRATKADRHRLGILRGNGTSVRVDLEDRVKIPRLETLRRELPSHYALRDIVGADSASRLLLRVSRSDPERIRHVAPDAELVYNTEYEIPGYAGFRARFRLFKAAVALEDPADKRLRRTGILVKGARGIYGCSFPTSELERDPAAEHYFGRLECTGIDQLAEEWDARREAGEEHPSENPMFILDPNRRGGLSDGHPFASRLYELPARILKQQFEQDREERRTQRRDVEAKETTRRLQNLARAASQFMRDKLDDLNLPSPHDVLDKNALHEKGVSVAPTFTQIPVGTARTFYVRAHKRLDLPEGTPLRVVLSKPAARAVEFAGTATSLEIDPNFPDALRGAFVVRGLQEHRRVQIECRVGDLNPVFAEVQVVAAEPIEPDIPGDFAFRHGEYRIRQGGRRNVVLRARFSRGDVPNVTFTLRDGQAAALRARAGFQRVPGTTYCEASVTVEGRRLGAKTELVAKTATLAATCTISVVAKEEPGAELRFQLVNYSLGENYRAVWDRREPNRLLITTRHESVSRYLGQEADGYPGQHDGTFRVLMAELISDNICRRIVEERVRALPHEFDSDRVYLMHNRLMKEFTPLAHKIQLANPAPSETA